MEERERTLLAEVIAAGAGDAGMTAVCSMPSLKKSRYFGTSDDSIRDCRSADSFDNRRHARQPRMQSVGLAKRANSTEYIFQAVFFLWKNRESRLE